MYTFKAQAKSNAKRFLVTTCKILADDVGQYLVQDGEGQWGTYIDADGHPVRHQLVYAAKRAADGMAPAGMANEAHVPETTVGEKVDPELQAALNQHDADGNDREPPPSSLGAFALSQLTAGEAPPPAVAPPVRTPSAVKIEKGRPTANGITRPSAGTTCARVWDLSQQLTDNLGRTAPLSLVVETAIALNINQFTARTQYACWRKFNGIVGRVDK